MPLYHCLYVFISYFQPADTFELTSALAKENVKVLLRKGPNKTEPCGAHERKKKQEDI